MESIDISTLESLIGNRNTIQKERAALPSIHDVIPAEMKPSAALDVKIQKANIPPRYKDCRFENFHDMNGEMREIAVSAYKYAKAFGEHLKNGEGLMFLGNVGRMKTSIACAVGVEVLKQNHSVYFCSMPELLDNLISMSKSKDRAEFNAYQSKLTNSSLLIIDDLGAEYPSDWIINKVDFIITHRHNYLKPTIITSNLVPKQIKEKYFLRIYDRLLSTSEVFVTTGDSLRKKEHDGK